MSDDWPVGAGPVSRDASQVVVILWPLKKEKGEKNDSERCT